MEGSSEWKLRISKVPAGYAILVTADISKGEFRIEFEADVENPRENVDKSPKCFQCGEVGHKASKCPAKGRRLRERRGLVDLGLHIGPSSPTEAVEREVPISFCPRCGVEGIPIGHECASVIALLETLAEAGTRVSGATEPQSEHGDSVSNIR